ncbi:MAG: GGDEF domain-containing protein [Bacillota bacterium]|nr:GGDEF domain-containing protein [Bacillota bacterium]
MRLSLYLNDYETEKTFSYVRWIFLLISALLFYYPPIDKILGYEHHTFSTLFIFGFVYMALSHFIFKRMDSSHRHFGTLIKFGILFDYIALMWLLLLTGGIQSTLYPISFLLVMHATIYWRTRGAFLASFFTSLGYSLIFLKENNVTEKLWIVFLMNIVFIWVIGLFGSLIVLRERKHIKMNEIYHELLVTDYLTGLYNHRHFQEHLRKLTTDDTPFYFVMGDIDSFKQINDKYGHLVGDEVLRVLGKVFCELSDHYNGLAFRYGGEEFAFLIPSTTEQTAHDFIRDIYKYMNDKLFTVEKWTATMSFGVALFKPGQTADELLSAADSLLYKAKANGKMRTYFEDGTLLINERQNVPQRAYI